MPTYIACTMSQWGQKLSPGRARQVVAVKKLHPLHDGETNNHKTFISEIHALTEIRHQNKVFVYIHNTHFWYMSSWKEEAW
uniref:Protein kinase domain-containing protein n=1 Tax=Quercus lobata TaxID=97700 RepID=A0A7N2LXQ9_QUELO